MLRLSKPRGNADVLSGGSAGDALPRCDAARYAGVKGRYRYYEVLWAAAPGEWDICAAIAEVEALLHCEAYRYGSAIGIVPYFLRAGHAITAVPERISHE